MTPPGQSECSICHLPLALSSRPVARHACPFCNRVFGRVDGARRHTKSCPERGDKPIPPTTKRGRKLRACDECSRIKVLCNTTHPCQRCSSRGLTCTYERFCTDPSHKDTITTDQPYHPHQYAARFSQFKFLLSCTDPRVNLVNDVLVAGEPESDPPERSSRSQLISLPVPEEEATIDPQLLFLGFMEDPYPDSPTDYDAFDLSMDYTGINAALSRPPNDNLNTRVSVLRDDLRELLDTHPSFRHDVPRDAFDKFFTAPNFERLMTIFFRRRQLLARMVHWPTFEPSKVDLSLLLAITLCGAAYSYKSAESLQHGPIMGILLQVAEKYIFKRLKKQSSIDYGSKPRSTLEVCQAAYLMITLQIGVNNSDTRRRAITKRHPGLVNAARQLGMIGNRHPELPAASRTDWHDFVYRESCIRLVTFVFFYDGLFALFCNSPPTTTLSEMCDDLPCSDVLWGAHSSEVFVCERMTIGPARPPCMRDIISELMRDDREDVENRTHELLNVFHLYAVIGGMY